MTGALVYVGTLIVDDEEDIRTLIRLMIQSVDRGLFVAGEAVDAIDALESIDAVDPRVVVLDEMMPGMRGIDAARTMLARRPELIIILCTAYLDEVLESEARAAGIKLCLRKEEFTLIPEALRAVQASLT
jgi:CheY-like chemotaxis protein